MELTLINLIGIRILIYIVFDAVFKDIYIIVYVYIYT